MCASEVQSGSEVAAHRVRQVRTGDEANVCEREQVRNIGPFGGGLEPWADIDISMWEAKGAGCPQSQIPFSRRRG